MGKKMRKLISICLLCVSCLAASNVYCAEAKAHNVTAVSDQKNGKTIEYLLSDDNYLRITQIVQNSNKVKINTSTFDNKLMLSGQAPKGTKLAIKVFNEAAGEKPTSTFDITVGTIGSFSQSIDIKEGNNKIIINYSNNDKKKPVKDYISFFVTRGKASDENAIKSYLAIPKM